MPQKKCGLLYATVASLVSPLTMRDPMINGLVVSALLPQKQNDIYIYIHLIIYTYCWGWVETTNQSTLKSFQLKSF